MTTPRTTEAAPQRARAALASYLRLLAACLQDEADMIERDTARSDEVLRRFREGILALSLDDAPLDVLLDRVMPAAGTEHSMVLSGTAHPARTPATSATPPPAAPPAGPPPGRGRRGSGKP